MQRVLTACYLIVGLFNADLRAAAPYKLMSFNIRFDGAAGAATDQTGAWLATTGKHRRDIALQVVREYDPDLLCVQEALANQIADFQAELNGHEFYGVGRDDGKQAGEYCGIFYRRERFTATDHGTFWLNEKSDQAGTRFAGTCCARIASWVILRDQTAGDREYLVVNTHWDHQIQAARLYSAKLIRQRLKQLAANRPILVAGDLNVTTDNPAFQRLVGPTRGESLTLVDSFRSAHPEVLDNEGTYHGFRGNSDGNRIDYVLHSDGFQTVTAQIVRAHQEGRFPADHFPVTATLMPVE